MLKVNVGPRNRGKFCERCGRALGEVAAYAFQTSKGRSFCGDCGEKLLDSTKSIHGNSQLMALNPPQFGGECSICMLWRRLLPWQVSVNGDWGTVCAECGKTMLVEELRSKLPGQFRKVALFEVLQRFGVNTLEAELLVTDFEKESFIAPAEGRQGKNGSATQLSPSQPGNEAAPSHTYAPRYTAPGNPSRLLPSTLPLENRNFYCWREARAVVPLALPRKRRHRPWRRMSPVEVFERCRKLSRELKEACQG